MLKTNLRWAVSLSLLGILVSVCGCSGGSDATTSAASDPAGGEQVDSDHDHDGHEAGGPHSGWWCDEHGVPESECSRCDPSLIAGFKAKGDWCDKHDLPESQCFKCDPTRAENFIARYEAKYGKKPPEPTE